MSVQQKLKILMVASEIAPFAKSGGLGDVVGSLPKALRCLGADVRVAFPKYRSIRADVLAGATFVDSFVLRLNWRSQSASIYELDGEVPAYMIENAYYFGREGLYGYGDDDERFAFFTKAAVEMLNIIDFKPDVIHFNDWQTGLGSVYLKDHYDGFTFFQDIATVFTIHNIQYQGNFPRESLERIYLNDGYFTPDKLEFYGRVNFMKAGLLYADAITAVSESYSKEIQTSQYGYGLDGLLHALNHKLYGILNGIDNERLNPATDTCLFENYDIDSLEKKARNKTALQKQLGLPPIDVPVISVISRLADQKGMDLIAVALDELMHLDIQFIVLGTGDGRYEHLFRDAAARYPDRMSANICFDQDLSQKIYAGSDMFLMPSLFEPCGLGQLFAMRYGTIPIVRRTGGLADTVRPFDGKAGSGNGFVFNDYVASGMMWGVKQALSVYRDEPAKWKKLVRNAMGCDFSWEQSAQKYMALYQQLKKQGGSA